ncbi:transmembrane protein 216-like [Stylophora pistillata]|uniref:Transmembrane protein 216 n=1 Tax=Stylophora pistillata TaxID=50429 RepID=A0A2B4SAZ2_STYPI|nr:transmembrane protein 216-like [Stylophora pistillata]PFX27051.1 Transmembrane protein 216 [Stylophora pistillata]
MAGNNRGKTVVELSSLPLQIFLFLNIWYVMVFCVAELLLYVYKGILLPYPDTAKTLTIEIIIIFLLAFIEGVRIFLGYKGNLAERTMALIFSVVLGIPVLFIDLFILLWQTYVLRIEVVLVSVALAFLGFEIIFSFAAIFTFKRHQTMLR